jgi:hypothetical protein
MSRQTLFALAAMCAFAPAFMASADTLPKGESRAVLAAPSAQKGELVIDGRIWRCDGTSCEAHASDMADNHRPARECHNAAVRFGAFTAYQTGPVTLSDAELKECNAGVSK